jgi:phosphoserine phosphatase
MRDSHSDLPMLSAVGNAVAVSPDVPLMRAATASQWAIVGGSSPSSRVGLPQ